MSYITSRHPATNRRRRPARLGFEDLEGRLVLATPAATLNPATAILQAAAISTRVTAPTTGQTIVVEDLVRNPQTGAITFSGTTSASILGQEVPQSFNGVIIPARNTRGVPTLTLIVPPTNQSVQGLNLATPGGTLTITPRRGAAGSSLIAGLNDVIGQAGTGSSDSAASALENLLGSSQVSGGVDRVIGTTKVVLRSFSVETATTPARLSIALRPVNVNAPGLGLRFSDGRNGPVRVDLAGTSDGGFLGDELVRIVGTGGSRAVLARLRPALALIFA